MIPHNIWEVACLLTVLSMTSKARRLSAVDQQCITGLSVVAPELAVPGKNTAILITLNGHSSIQRTFNVTLRLLDSSQISRNSLESYSQPLLEITQEVNGRGILQFKVPSHASGSCLLETLVNCTTGNDVWQVSDEECELRTSSEMRLVGPVRDVIVRPAKHVYRPGEAVQFWILALNHDLQVASGAIGSVSMKDPQGTKVAIWDQVALDEGVKSFTLPLSPYATKGRWTVQVEAEQSQFSAYFDVISSNNGGLPDIAVAEEHYVELRFSKDMRRRYKPGLPFSGKVQAMSTEKSVRVRVKVYDNTTSIYSQDIEISNGESSFVVPAIMADSDEIALQAELVSLENKEIESHYVLAREPIKKWNSSSECYLLIQDVEPNLQPNDVAHVAILSTCPCIQDMHLLITTEGRITDWAEKLHTSYETTTEPNGSCKIKFSFTVKSVMAPVSQLLVYYITPRGEPVSDISSFNVKLINGKIHLNLGKKNWWLPKQYLDLELTTEPSSLVCILGAKSLSVGPKFDPTISEHQPSQVTGEVDFLEAGVSFFQQECARRGDSLISAITYRQQGSGAGPSGQIRNPSESLLGGASFDQLWMWTCLNHSNSYTTKVSITAPDQAGKWFVWALSVSNAGLSLSRPLAFQVFKPLEVEFGLPPTLRVRETVEVDIQIRNNVNACVDVTALLALSEGAQFVNNGLLYVTERLRLGPHGETTLVVRILVTSPGIKNLTVEVNGYTSSNCDGGGDLDNSTLSGAVVHSSAFKVIPEGIIRSHTESAYFCANENLIVSTSNDYRYEWIQAPRNHQSIVVEVKSSNGPVYVALSESKTKLDKMYRVTIGNAGNTLCHIGRGGYNSGIQLASVETPSILTQEGWGTYWISWEKDVISFGNGSSANINELLSWKMDKKFKIGYIGFASAWGILTEFRIWNFSEEAGFSQVLHLNTPKKVVPGSEWGELEVTGGMAMPQVKNMEGGGLTESIASLTPLLNIQNNNLGKVVERNKLITTLPETIQSILSFRKEDNSFSEHPMIGSHRTTVSVLEALAKVQHYFSIDPDLIQAIKKWVQLRQEDDGRFTPLNADTSPSYSAYFVNASENLTSDAISTENIVEATAETVIALYEIGIESDSDSDTVQKAKVFLENSLPTIQLPQTIAAVTLALVLVRSVVAAWAIEKLKNASTTDDKEFGWQHFSLKKDAADWLYESDSEKILKEPLVATVEEYRASLHALSTFCITGDIKSAESAARFLFYRSHVLDNHYELLYPAVKAFSKYDGLARDKHRSLIVSLATSGMELTDTLELNKNKASQTLYLPSLPTKIFVYATGAGCATIQGKITYSTYEAIDKTSLLELGSEVAEEIRTEPRSLEEIEGKMPGLTIKSCFVWKGQKPSPILRLEVSLFSGFVLTSSPPKLLGHPQEMAEMQHTHHDNQVWFTFANVTINCPICVQFIVRSQFIITAIKPAYARIYPSGRKDLAAETFFHAYTNSALLRDVSADDLITWFSSNQTFKKLESNRQCQNHGSFAQLTTNLSPILEKTKLVTETSEINAKVLNDSISLDKREKYSAEKQSVRAIDQEKAESELPRVSFAEVTYIPKITYQSRSLNRHFETVSLDTPNEDRDESNSSNKTLSYSIEKSSVNKDVTRWKPDNITPSFPQHTAPSPLTQTKEGLTAIKGTELTNIELIRRDDYRSRTSKNLSIIPIATSKHINIEQIHDIPKHMLLEESDDLKEAKSFKYVLLNKESLWSMLREAVDDEFRRKKT